MPRNHTIDICKGLAIILMVIGHAEAPGWLVSFIYVFHMPVFFITAGYFFTRQHADNAWDFCRKRVKGLYWPFLKWSVFFLLIHNLLFKVGILNEQYGNWENGVTHPYTWHQAVQRLVHMVFSMGGYDEFLAGAFWFFRALLLSSIVFLILYRLIDGRHRILKGSVTPAVICVLALLFTWFKIYNGLKITTVVQGGIRECWGVFFFGAGMLFKHYEDVWKGRHWLAAICLVILAVGAHFHWAGMNLKPKTIDVLTLPLTGCAGFLFLHYVSSHIDSWGGVAKRFLAHCGEMTVYIYVFHISAYKVVSLMKIWWYGLPFGKVGCHMVIHDYKDDGFWVLYTLAGVGLPLLWMWGYRKIQKRYSNKFPRINNVS